MLLGAVVCYTERGELAFRSSLATFGFIRYSKDDSGRLNIQINDEANWQN
jgi:hypothetical protein